MLQLDTTGTGNRASLHEMLAEWFGMALSVTLGLQPDVLGPGRLRSAAVAVASPKPKEDAQRSGRTPVDTLPTIGNV